MTMRRDQLLEAKRGVDLLLAYLKGVANDFDDALDTEDVNACQKCADPMMYVATILTRQLRDVSGGTVATALASARKHVDAQFSGTDVDSVTQFISGLISGRLPDPISTGTIVVALIARDLAVGAATEIANLQNAHVNAAVAKLRVALANQDDSVQLSDRAGADAASEEYAADINMRKARHDAAFNITNYWNSGANVLHDAALQDGLSDAARDTLTALSLMTVTCAALTGGIYQLAEHGNLYPASALLRQLVEAEFIMWRFAQDVDSMAAWLNSTEEERRTAWRPSTIYRDTNNEYRQKDYAGHCELCGHPTPIGTRIAAGVQSSIPLASLFSDEIHHSRDAWQHLMQAAGLIDARFGTKTAADLAALNSAFRTTLLDHKAVDLYGYATGFFSDPIDS
jgi:hypothetical protein